MPRHRNVLLLALIAVALFTAASIGMCDIAGFGAVDRRINNADWPWLALVAPGVGGGILAYSFAWTGIMDAGDGPVLDRRERWLAPIVGFGGFLLRGGSTVDRHLLEVHGVPKREITVRLTALDGLEHAPLAIGCFVLGVVALTTGKVDPPPLDFVVPWVAIPPVGTAAAVLLTRRYRESLAHRTGILGWFGIVLDSLYLLWQIVSVGRVPGRCYVAMAAFWACEMLALWSALRVFGESMPVGAVVFAYVAAYVVTRRPAPFGGAGPLDLFLPLCLWTCGSTLATAVAGTIAFRLVSLWLPFPFALRGSQRLAGGNGADEHEPALA
jgi:uncharacterized membrane protein YbhN (UPF0104 family)